MGIIWAILRHRKVIMEVYQDLIEPVEQAAADGRLDEDEKELLCAVMWANLDWYLGIADKSE